MKKDSWSYKILRVLSWPLTPIFMVIVAFYYPMLFGFRTKTFTKQDGTKIKE